MQGYYNQMVTYFYTYYQCFLSGVTPTRTDGLTKILSMSIALYAGGNAKSHFQSIKKRVEAILRANGIPGESQFDLDRNYTFCMARFMTDSFAHEEGMDTVAQELAIYMPLDGQPVHVVSAHQATCQGVDIYANWCEPIA